MIRMSAAWRGQLRHFALCLELSLRSKQALIYGYAVPLLFLLAFGSVFRAETPTLLGEMGQLLTITILGGACFGMPTSLVSERERGIWKRYRLLPVPAGSLVGGVLAARLVLVASAVALQVGVAHLAYQTPFPIHPIQLAAAVVIVTGSLLGLGLVIAALADDVPSVQALGQCIFLPMIMIGGVGIPLLALPGWAQKASGFMPGRYAVRVLELSYGDPVGLRKGWFALIALAVIGASAAVAGGMLFRWDTGRRTRPHLGWTALALVGWLAVGLAATATGRLAPPQAPGRSYADITEAQMDGISYENLPGDDEFVSRLARPDGRSLTPQGIEGFSIALRAWNPGHTTDPGQRVRSLLSIAALADVGRDVHEGEIARFVFDQLRAEFGDERLARILAWIILYPQEGAVVTLAPELGLEGQYKEVIIRQRIDLYARKYLGRLRGRISD